METLDGKEGKLEFILGTGWLSRHEASRLAPGALLRGTRMAGTGYELRFNGERMADAAAVVIGSGKGARLCSQIESLERASGILPEPARGSDLTELLPFSISLGGARAGLADLAGLGRTSVIDLGIEAGDLQEAELLVAGFPAARGVVNVIGESMGIRVTEILAGFAPDAPFRSSSALVDPARCREKIADYDFRMPDCFTRPQIEALAGIHGDFVRSLASLAGAESGCAALELDKVDQLNFTEFMESLPEGELLVAAPCAASSRPRVPEGERPAKAFLDLSGAPAFPPAEALARVRAQQERPLGGAVLAAGGILASDRDIVFAALRDAWKGFGALSPFPRDEFRRGKDGPARALSAYAEEYEMVALASFRSGGEGWLNIAYPMRAIEPVLRTLTA